MCVCLLSRGVCAHWVGPCVTQFCSNRFWQLCNFCWFIPDLGNLFFCYAGVICFTHTHRKREEKQTTTLCTQLHNSYTYTHTQHLNMNLQWPVHTFMPTSSHSHIHPPPTPSTHINTHTLSVSGSSHHSGTSQWQRFQFHCQVMWLNGSLVRWDTSSAVF